VESRDWCYSLLGIRSVEESKLR